MELSAKEYRHSEQCEKRGYEKFYLSRLFFYENTEDLRPRSPYVDQGNRDKGQYEHKVVQEYVE